MKMIQRVSYMTFFVCYETKQKPNGLLSKSMDLNKILHSNHTVEQALPSHALLAFTRFSVTDPAYLLLIY